MAADPTATTGARRPRPRLTGRAALLVLVVAMLMVSYASSLRAYLDQREHLGELRARIAASQENIAQLEREKRRWQDPAYVEAQARQRFGWVMPGEIGFQVIDENGEPLDAADTLTDPAAAPEPDAPEWWQTTWASVKEAGQPRPDPPPAERIRAPKQKRDR